MDMDLSSPPSSSPPYLPYTNCTITNPRTFSVWLDEIGPQNMNTINHLFLYPSQHLGRISSIGHLDDALGDSFGDNETFSELHDWITLLQRLANLATGIRSLTIYFAADMSGNDTHGYRRGVGEDYAFIWAIGQFHRLEAVDLRGYFPIQWPWYLRQVWGGRGQETQIYNLVPAPEHLLEEWRRGTERLDPRELGWH